MSDQASSGQPSEAPAATAGPASTAASSGNQPAPAGSFGTAKGTGLSRGKRPSASAATAAPGTASGYQPSALEVLRPQSEYKNPFTGETSVPVVNEPSAALPAESRSPSPPTPPVAAKEVAPPPAAALARAPANESELFPFTPDSSARPAPADAPVSKAELNILPTEQVKRPAVSWGDPNVAQQNEARPRRDDRPTFQPREQRPFEPRQPRDPREGRETRDGREPRRDFSSEPRRTEPRFERPVQNEPVKKSGGFISWLKGLFGAKPAEASIAERPNAGSEEHQRQHRRRHRGGRGRGSYQGGGENRGPRENQPRDPSFEGGQPRPEGEGSGENRYEGGGRRRRRGGRGRFRDDSGPRPEGQQGGGAI
ncbi:MAG: translation initiation factor [Verrucomicrobia bacterium]|nr:translation initiation factor [Verrucomicrobiota bacterium]